MTAADSPLTVIVVTGPTGSGKTDLAIGLARHLGCHILGADSRQIYRGMPIATAAPTPGQLAAAPHHFVGILELTDGYSAATYEEEALATIGRLRDEGHSNVVVCGGSMMYIDALLFGIDSLPSISPAVREAAAAIYRKGGLEATMNRLQTLDPEYARIVDPFNHKRIVHAIEICMEAGRPYSELRTGLKRKRDFSAIRMAIDLPREQLFSRINRRVDVMVEAGLEEEARRLYPQRGLNSLNTVGLKEMFAMIEGSMDRDTAIARIGKNTRVYAKKQLTWMKRYDDLHLLNPGSPLEEALEIIAKH